MRVSQAAMWRWAFAVMIVTATLGPVSGSCSGDGPAGADQQRTFWGKTIDAWVEALRDRSSRDHSRAPWALRHFGPEAKAAVPDLVEMLRRGDPGAVNVLARIGPDAAPAVPLLAKELRKEECLHSKTGSFGYNPYGGPKYALVRIGTAAVPELVKALDDLDGERRPCAAEALGMIGPPAKAGVPALIRALQVQQPKLDFQDLQAQALRRQAIIALGRIGPEAATAIPALNVLFDQGDDEDDFYALRALSRIGSPPVAKLTKAFPREGVADDLAYLGPKAKEAVPTLQRALSAKSSRVRFDAAQALACIDPSATDAIPVLIEALDHLSDEAVDVRKVPQILAQIGPNAKSAIPALLAQLTPEWAEPEILRALVQLDPEGRQCVPALIEALKQKEPDVVFTASECLGLLGPRARASIPALVAVIDGDLSEDSPNWHPRVSAINGLLRIDRESPLVIPALIRALKGEEIKEFGEAWDELDVCDCTVLEAAAKAIGSLGPRAKAAVPAMIDILTNRNHLKYPYTAFDAVAYALGQIGPDAKPAIPILRQLLEEPGPNSWSAATALYQLAPDGKELAKKQLERGLPRRESWPTPEGRAMLLGAMGRTSVEADAVIRSELEQVDDDIEAAEIEGDDLVPEWVIAQLSRFGAGSRLAIPRLNELRRHRFPWIRLWASEALARIAKSGT